MPRPSIYLDECVDVGLVVPLRQRGYSVATVQAAGMTGFDDDDQLAYAAQRELTILSHNQRHFQRWHAIFERQGRPHAGIALIPQCPLPRLEIRAAMMLSWIATLSDYRSGLFRWHDLQYQLTHGYRVLGYSEDEVRAALGQSTWGRLLAQVGARSVPSPPGDGLRSGHPRDGPPARRLEWRGPCPDGLPPARPDPPLQALVRRP